MKRGARRLLGTVTAAVMRYFNSGAPDFAAGIAYRVLFALAPLSVALVSVFGLILENKEVKNDVINKIVSTLPVKTQNVTQAIEHLAAPASAAGLVSLVVLVWAASGMMTAIRFGLERTMGVEEDRSIVHGKLVDIALVAATAALLLASLAIGLVTQIVNGLVSDLAHAVDLQATVARAVISKVLPLLLWTGTLLLVYRLIPAKRPRFQNALAGAALAALLLLAISLIAGVIYSHATKWSAIYGSLTSVFVFLYTVYLFASAVLLGAAFTTEWSEPHEAHPGRVLTKARRRIRELLRRGKRSRREQRG